MPKFDRTLFFDGFRQFLKPKPLTQQRVEAVEFLLIAFENDPEWRSIPQIAYALATIAHETAWTFKPITEYGNKSYFDKYNAGTRIGKTLGNTENGDGYCFRGRGFVQITGRNNYRKFGLEQSPELALDPPTAFSILSVGMQVGSFTGKKISHFINTNQKDYINARKVINGLDKAKQIAGYAQKLETILKTSAKAPVTNDANKVDLPESPDPPQEPSPNESNVNIGTAGNVNIPPPSPPPSNTPVMVTKERTSVWAKIAAGFAAISGLGISMGNMIQSKLEALAPQHFAYVLGGIFLILAALYFYEKAQKRAHEKTLAKMATAADPAQNTVKLS